MYVNYNNSRAKKKNMHEVEIWHFIKSFFLLTTAALWFFDPFFLAM